MEDGDLYGFVRLKVSEKLVTMIFFSLGLELIEVEER